MIQDARGPYFGRRKRLERINRSPEEDRLKVREFTYTPEGEDSVKIRLGKTGITTSVDGVISKKFNLPLSEDIIQRIQELKDDKTGIEELEGILGELENAEHHDFSRDFVDQGALDETPLGRDGDFSNRDYDAEGNPA